MGMASKSKIQPSLEAVQALLEDFKDHEKAPTLVPLCTTIPADLLTPSSAYLKISAKSKSGLSFLFESAATTETIGRFSFLGADPRKVLKTGAGHGPSTDPLPLLAAELAQHREAQILSLNLPPMTGGAVGYVGYDCVQHFEPKTARPLADVLGVPESLFMFFDTIVAFDHFFQVVKVMTYLHVPRSSSALPAAYGAASATLRSAVATLLAPETPLPPQPPIVPDQRYTSNVGQAGYEAHVRTLQTHIARGDIIQAVPSQRLARPTSLHPFNIYRHLRTVNPSPYLFYLACGAATAIVGASPELLVKADAGRIVTHPIAGTVKRGASAAEDAALAAVLRASLKDRAEHVMLVDLARNDVNRVCDPLSTRVDRLMVVERFSHVQHLVSQVSGVLRKDKNRFDAFRSIFPAGTVSGAPKVRAMELIAELEGEKRGVYAGAVGWFGYDGVQVTKGGKKGAGKEGEGEVEVEEEEKEKEGVPVVEVQEGAMDTCIALRTMLVKEGVAYLQAGGGIVFDSVPFDEWEETMNKLGANMQCIEGAEERYGAQGDGALGLEAAGEERREEGMDVKVDFAAG